MKYGMRTPSPKRSIKSKTTGKITRASKKVVNPTYGKKGTGVVKDPKKAIYNKVYNKTTFTPVSENSNDSTHFGSQQSNKSSIGVGSIIFTVIGIVLLIVAFILLLSSIFSSASNLGWIFRGLLSIITGLLGIVVLYCVYS